MATELEKILLKSHKSTLMDHMNSHEGAFEEAVQIVVHNKLPYSWRASWVLWSCMEKNDKRILKYAKKLVRDLPSRPDNQQREIVKIFQMLDVTDSLEGALYSACAGIWEQVKKQASLRFNAMKLMIQIAKKHPEFDEEIQYFLQERYTGTLSHGVLHSLNLMVGGRV